MNLSSIITGVPEYIEFGWVTAPNAAAQSISANTITKLTLNTEVADTGGIVSAPTSDQFTLPAGTYYYEASTATRGTYHRGAILMLFNATGSSYTSRSGASSGYSFYSADASTSHAQFSRLNGQFTISATTTFELRISTDVAATVTSGVSDSTAGTDQRTTIKLWKLK